MTKKIKQACLVLVGTGAVLFTSLGVEAKGTPRFATVEWRTQGIAPAPEASVLPADRKVGVLFTKIRPTDTFKAPQEMTTGGDTISAGATLARTLEDRSQFCEPVRRRKQSRLYCVSDSDGDSILDTMYLIPVTIVSGSTSVRREFLIGSLRMYSGSKLKSPVPISSLTPEPEPESLEVQLVQTGKSRFSLCISRYTGSALLDGAGDALFCGMRWEIKPEDFPVTLDANGGRIELTRLETGQVAAKISAPPAGGRFPGLES